MGKTDFQYHIQLGKGDVGRYVLMPGDPGRVKKIAAHFDDPKKLVENREYTTYTGTLDGVPVAAISTGIGGPSTAICVEELHRIGVDTMIRVGTSGSLQPTVKIGELVIGTAAVRDEGTSQQYVPLHFPAVAHFDVVTALERAAREQKHAFHLGILHCKDSFFAEEPECMPNPTYWEQRWSMWQRAGVLCTEMESGPLFVVGGIRGIRTGEVVAVIGETHEGKLIIRKEGVEEAIQTAIGAIRLLIAQDREKGLAMTIA